MKIQCNFIIIRNRHLNSMCQTIFFQKTHKSVLHIYSRHSDNSETLNSNGTRIFGDHFRIDRDNAKIWNTDTMCRSGGGQNSATSRMVAVSKPSAAS